MVKEVKKGDRTRKLSRTQKKQVAKNEARKNTQLPSSFKLSWLSITTIKKFWRPLGGITLVYFILSLLFVSGFSSLNLAVLDIKENLQNTAGSGLGDTFSGFFNFLANSATTNTQLASVLQTIFVVLVSLALIWTLRQVLAGNKVGTKHAYYHSMTPLIPFLLIVLVIFIQLLPVSLGAGVISTVASTIFNPSGMLTFILLLCYLGLLGWSLYMVSSSIFALYIVTLPDMQPRQSLRSAKNLVRFRRVKLMLKVLFLPLIILLGMGLVIMPLIIFVPGIVVPVFYGLSALAILFSHTYLYNLYRSLLD